MAFQTDLVKQGKYFKWLEMPVEKRVLKTQKEMSRFLGVSTVTLTKWAKKYKTKDIPDDELGLKEFLKKLETHAFAKGNPKAFELLGKAKGFLTEKNKEINLGELTADDYYRIRKEASERLTKLQREPHPVGDVQPESQALSTGVLLSPEPEQSPDSQVGTVVIST